MTLGVCRYSNLAAFGKAAMPQLPAHGSNLQHHHHRHICRLQKASAAYQYRCTGRPECVAGSNHHHPPEGEHLVASSDMNMTTKIGLLLLDALCVRLCLPYICQDSKLDPASSRFSESTGTCLLVLSCITWTLMCKNTISNCQQRI